MKTPTMLLLGAGAFLLLPKLLNAFKSDVVVQYPNYNMPSGYSQTEINVTPQEVQQTQQLYDTISPDFIQFSDLFMNKLNSIGVY